MQGSSNQVEHTSFGGCEGLVVGYNTGVNETPFRSKPRWKSEEEGGCVWGRKPTWANVDSQESTSHPSEWKIVWQVLG